MAQTLVFHHFNTGGYPCACSNIKFRISPLWAPVQSLGRPPATLVLRTASRGPPTAHPEDPRCRVPYRLVQPPPSGGPPAASRGGLRTKTVTGRRRRRGRGGARRPPWRRRRRGPRQYGGSGAAQHRREYHRPSRPTVIAVECTRISEVRQGNRRGCGCPQRMFFLET